MNIGSSSPSEKEETDCWAETSEKCWHETRLLCSETVLEDIGDEEEVEVGHVDSDADEAGDENTSEDYTDHTERETIHGWIDQGEDLKERVIDTINDGSVNVYESDGWILDSNFDWLDDGVDDDCRWLHVLLIDFGLGLETVVTSELSETLSAAEENVGGGGLWETHEHDQEDWTSCPEDFPEGPSPSLSCDSET